MEMICLLFCLFELYIVCKGTSQEKEKGGKAAINLTGNILIYHRGNYIHYKPKNESK